MTNPNGSAFPYETNDAADIVEALNNIQSALIPSGWKKKKFTLSQTDVRTLKTANAGLGYKLFESLLSGMVQIANPVFLFKGNTGAYNSVLSIYSENAPIRIFEQQINVAEINGVPITFSTYINPDPIGFNSYYTNDAIYIYSGIDLPTYIGTAELILDYREITF